jgi:hypothetical protein
VSYTIGQTQKPRYSIVAIEMAPRVQALIDYYRWSELPLSHKDVVARQADARTTYAELTHDEQIELARLALSESVQVRTWLLTCLACFYPGSLVPLQKILVQNRVLWPSEIFFGADRTIAEGIIEIAENGQQTIGIGDARDILCALAWIGDEVAQSAFRRWQSERPAWVPIDLHQPLRLTTDAGWELTPDGRRRDLFCEKAFPLIQETGASHRSPVRIGAEHIRGMKGNWLLESTTGFRQSVMTSTYGRGAAAFEETDQAQKTLAQ